MTAPAGAVVGIYVDLVARVREGDIIQTESGRRYQVMHVREQTRGMHVGRQHLRVLVLGDDDGDLVLRPDGAPSEVHVIRWYKRTAKRKK